MPHLHPFQESFWSPTASIDPFPNFNAGYTVLHSKLKQSMAENKAIVDYIKQRINAEKTHATLLGSITISTSPFEKDVGGALKKCFEVVCAESDESAKEHFTRASNLNTMALEPLLKFSGRYDRIITQAKKTIETQINRFNAACKAMEDAKTSYVNRCKSLQLVQPDFTNVEVGKGLQFFSRNHAWIWFSELFRDQVYTKDQIVGILKDVVLDEENAVASLVGLGFIKQENNNFIRQKNLIFADEPDNKTSNYSGSKKFPGFLGKWGGQPQQVKKDELMKDMLEADNLYRQFVNKVELMRTQTEQILFAHYEEMESLELERIQTIKQETLKPDKDVQFIVEQYRTGQYCPKPILYENYFHSAAAGSCLQFCCWPQSNIALHYHNTTTDQLFGVSLEEITKVQGSMVPRLITIGLSVIEAEKNVIWTASLPLDRIHAARAEINSNKPITAEILQRFDIILLASLLRLYLLELPDCLFTFELYEPEDQDKDSRLMSISKLLATLPTANYHTVMVLLNHFHKLVKQTTTSAQFTSSSLAKSFCYVLMRPQIESKVSIHERHPQRLLHDLIENFGAIFTQESHYAQERNSTRPSIVVSTKEVSITKANSLNDGSTASASSRTSTSSISVTRRTSILSSIMRSSQSTPTSMKPKIPLTIPMPSPSTLFEDPDEIERSSESSLLETPSHTVSPSTEPHDYKSVHLGDSFVMDDLASLDSFFEDED
ncbi:hypothetical protein [Parasitella parasitica]|uniref:Rho-GAP domain-containing protein n=1 Tax=Parasitella parasitica TaxID=35722 RepID=A0A0B7NCS2_9FUNG|nr:hypothetical protein [Parasitella parasitica]